MEKPNDYTIKATYLYGRGRVERMTYGDGSLALAFYTAEGRDTLSTNLAAYGLVAPEGHVYVKDVSEHEGLPKALHHAGIAEEVPNGKVTFGPFDSTAYLMKVIV